MSERPPQHTRDPDPRRRLVRRAGALPVPDRWACCVERWTRRPDVAASRLADARFPGTRSVLFRRSRRIHHRRKGYRSSSHTDLAASSDWVRVMASTRQTADPTRHGCPDRIHITRRWIWRVGQQAQILAPRERKPGALLLCHRRTKHSGVSNQDHQTRWSLFRRCLSPADPTSDDVIES